MLAKLVAFTACLISLAVNQPTTQPEWRHKFNAVYSLGPDQVLKHIAPPLIDERLEFYRATDSVRAEAVPEGPSSMIVRWPSRPAGVGHFFGFESGVEVELLARAVVSLPRHQIEIASEIGTQKIAGDWSVQRDADPSTILTEFVRVVSRVLGQKLSLTQQDVEEPAIIVTGSVRKDPAAEFVPVTLSVNGMQFPRELTGDKGYCLTFLDSLGQATGYIVENKTTRASAMLQWSVEGAADVGAVKQLAAADLGALLNSISEQTGLNFVMEPRKFRRWTISVEK